MVGAATADAAMVQVVVALGGAAKVVEDDLLWCGAVWRYVK